LKRKGSEKKDIKAWLPSRSFISELLEGHFFEVEPGIISEESFKGGDSPKQVLVQNSNQQNGKNETG
jgi:hypothetical protein